MKRLTIIILTVLTPVMVFGNTTSNSIDSGDTAWVLMATAMVMLMTPAGLALFYGGMTRSKSVLNTIGMSYTAFFIATIAWVAIGYSIAFGESVNGIIGSLDHLFLNGIGVNDITGSIPTLLFVTFQGVFAAIAVAIVSGSIIERIKFSTWIIFALLWVICVYAPLAHWVWGGGFLSNSGELDFAGGTVIHVNAGVAGLVVAYLIGKRKNHGKEEALPSSIKLTALGSALLWFGWFGFNAGSQLAADGIAVNALLVTNIAACTGGLAWLLIEWNSKKKPTLLGAVSGLVSGLVGITPAAGYVDVSAAFAIGIISGAIGYFGVMKLKKVLGYDDSLDAFGIHGLVGIWGALATGIFANPAVNEGVGLLFGNPKQLLTQLTTVVVTVIFSAVATAIVFKLSALITKGARVDAKMELKGLDQTLHGERGFNIQIEKEELKITNIN